jgi:hypothetical protein
MRWVVQRDDNKIGYHAVGESNELVGFEKVDFSIFYTSGDGHSLNLLKHMAKYYRAIFNYSYFHPKIVTFACNKDCNA